MAAGGDWIRRGTRVLCAILLCASLAAGTLWFLTRDLPAPGDISAALSLHPGAYTLSLGHIEDLTLKSFAYLRTPLLVAAIAFLIGAIGTLRATGEKAFLAAAIMAVLFFQAARMALVVFDPYMSSRPLAEALQAVAAREAHRRSSLLHVFLDLFLYQPRCPAVERADQQPGVRIVRARRAGYFYQRRAMEEHVDCTRPLLPGGQPVRAASPSKSGGKRQAQYSRRKWREGSAHEFTATVAVLCVPEFHGRTNKVGRTPWSAADAHVGFSG